MTRHSPSAHSGFTLLEVLVAVVLLSIGLLGIAGLQLNSLRGNHSAFTRTLAVNLSNDVAERLRANEANCACLLDNDCDSTSLPDCIPDAWTNLVSDELPNGESTVCFDSTPNDGDDADNADCSGIGDILAVKIWWNDTRNPDAGLQRFSTPVIP